MEMEVERLTEFTLNREVGAITMEAKVRKRKADQAVVNVTITASEKATKEVRYKMAFRKPKNCRSTQKIEPFNREEYEKGVPVRADNNLHVPSAWYNAMAHWAHQILFG